MNPIQIFFIVLMIFFVIIGGPLSFCKQYLPNFFKQVIPYGRFAEKGHYQFLNKLDIPKRWFKHFYIFGLPISVFALYLASSKFFFNNEIPEYVFCVLDFLFGNDRKPLVPPANALLALILFTIHLSKRLFECLKISVFSNAKMNIAHYTLAFMHYFFVIIVIIGETAGFVRGSEVNFQNSLKIKDWLGASLFLWMTFKQLESNIILANLRKNKKGEVVTLGYKIPEGGLFDYISAPLQFTETGVYGALQIILCQSLTFKFTFFWVLTNQFICAILGHQWNIKKFKDYPPTRKIIIPFLL